MFRLLKANFYKLLRSRIYWVLFAFMIFFDLRMPVLDSRSLTLHQYQHGDETLWTGWSIAQDYTYATHIWLLSYAAMILISLFIGDDFSSGTLRNKILAGHSRSRLYTCYFITSYIGLLIMHIVSESISLLYCLKKYGLGLYYRSGGSAEEMIRKDLLCLVKLNIIAMISMAAYVGIVILCMVIVRRKTPAFISVMIWDIFSNMYISSKSRDIIYFHDSENIVGEKRSIILMSLDPNGLIQSTRHMFETYEYFSPCLICCAVTTCIILISGIILMNKRDLK